jgi:hypothetical protein
MLMFIAFAAAVVGGALVGAVIMAFMNAAADADRRAGL